MGIQGLHRIHTYLRRHYVPFASCVGIVVMLEFLSRGGAGAAFAWSLTHIIRFGFNAAIVYCLLLLLTALIGRTRVSFWVLAPVLLVLGLISGIKLKVLGIPLLPWDFVLSSETKDMTPYLNNILSWSIGFALLFFFLFSYWMMRLLPRHLHRLSWKERGITAAIAIAVLAVLYTDKPIPLKRAFAIEGILWDQSDNVKTNGFTLTTLMNMEQLFVSKLTDYSSEMVFGIMKQHAPPDGGPSSVKPNVIVVLSESLWDVTQIPGIEFNQDPLPHLHALQKQFPSGTLLSPQFGGGTANVEFEVLTGNSMRFLPQGSVPYNQFIHGGVDSLASILARQGYSATAVSPYHAWYFNSNEIYKNFGFHNYVSLEFFKPVYEGPYIADREVGQVIIDASKKTSGPDFIFANTMENHFHYFPGKFADNPIRIRNDYPAETKGMLETYARGAYDADRMLQQLVDYYNSVDEPTILVFFGDHLPSLGDQFKAYKESKYITGDTDPGFLDKMYRTPILVWNNYLPEQPAEKLNMSPSFVSPYVLNMAHLQGSYFTDYLHELYGKIPVIPPKNYFVKMGIKEGDLKPYETLQYDILFGEQHAYKEKGLRILDPDYLLGFGPMKLESADPPAVLAGGGANGDWTVHLTGQNLPSTSIVYVNGKKASSSWESQTAITVNIPPELQKAFQLDIDVRVIDSQDKTIGQTNVVQVAASSLKAATP
ncbi:LTA synthase family protein [Paenibacillus sp. HJGM_3]|uniref:LTA synthase family protein n=1 Tax=Paenibacillus sp. HJGM_3 TaxID=3379816 RepID=UPI00385FB5A9